jgi:hypothetical protein
MSETELQVQPKRRGRPKTVNITDKKEYNKQYYEQNRENILEQKREYIGKLKINEPEKYKEGMQKFKEHGNELQKKALCIYKLIKELTKSGVLSLPESHKEIILELIN